MWGGAGSDPPCVWPPQTLQENMQALFGALAEAEERQPYLSDAAVRRGTRGLAQHHLGDHGPAWNRCAVWLLCLRCCCLSRDVSSSSLPHPRKGGARGTQLLSALTLKPCWSTTLRSLPLARCWVVDRVDTWAVVMFIDFGQLATIPVRSLRSLDSDDFWAIPTAGSAVHAGGG